MQNYDLHRKKSILSTASDTLDFAMYTVFLQVIIVFQSAFMFVAALQANELISGAISNEITSKEVSLKIATIFSLVPVTILTAYLRHVIVNLNTASAKKYKKIIESGANMGDDEYLQELNIFGN